MPEIEMREKTELWPFITEKEGLRSIPLKYDTKLDEPYQF
jgi:hypothetical protein